MSAVVREFVNVLERIVAAYDRRCARKVARAFLAATGRERVGLWYGGYDGDGFTLFAQIADDMDLEQDLALRRTAHKCEVGIVRDGFMGNLHTYKDSARAEYADEWITA